MKKVGYCVYAHGSAMYEVCGVELARKAQRIINQAHYPTWDYFKYNKKTGKITFVWCRGWHELHEPVVTQQIIVDPEEGTRRILKVNSFNPPIIPGKHLFAGTNHPEEVGFNIEEAKERWDSYQGTDWLDKSRMGFLKWWREHAYPRIGK